MASSLYKESLLKKGGKRGKKRGAGYTSLDVRVLVEQEFSAGCLQEPWDDFFSPVLAHKHPPLPSLFIFFVTPWLEKRHLPDG